MNTDAILLGWLASITKLGAILGLSSAILVSLLGQPRIFYSTARDGLLHPFAAIVHPRFRTPYITTLFAFAVVCLGVLVLRITHPEIDRPFKTPAVFAVAPLGAVSAVFLMFGLPGDTRLRLAVWLIIGLAIYFFYGRNHTYLTRRR